MDNKLDPRVIEAINAVNIMVVGVAPSVAAASQLNQIAFCQGLAALNAVFAQQQAWMQFQTVTAIDTKKLLGG